MQRGYSSNEINIVTEKKEEAWDDKEACSRHDQPWNEIVRRITNSIESLRVEQTVHSSSVGEKFLTWVKQTRNNRQKENLETADKFDFSAYLPPIDTCIKIYKITSIDVTLNQFICDFNVVSDTT